MKWSQFKKIVDEKLKELGVDDPEISYIDFTPVQEADIFIEQDSLIIQ